jgi:hypothetical protein
MHGHLDNEVSLSWIGEQKLMSRCTSEADRCSPWLLSRSSPWYLSEMISTTDVHSILLQDGKCPHEPLQQLAAAKCVGDDEGHSDY